MIHCEIFPENSLGLTDRKKVVKKGQTLFELDQKAETAFLVLEGVIIVGCSSPNGREVITSVYFPGEICGALSVLADAEYLGSARAPKKADAVVTPLSRADLLQHIENDSKVYQKLLQTQRAKQKFKDRMILGIVAESCQQRAASALLWLQSQSADTGENPSKLYLCRQELADLIGTTVETVIRILSRFRKNGDMTEQRGLITLNVPSLNKLALGA